MTIARVPGKPGPHPTPISAPFWEAASEGRLVMQRCDACGRWQHYPRNLCAGCWSAQLQWREATGTGTIWTLTVAHRPGHPAWVPEVPYAIAIVELDEGPRILANLAGDRPEELQIGDRVRVSFEAREGYSAVQFTSEGTAYDPSGQAA